MEKKKSTSTENISEKNNESKKMFIMIAVFVGLMSLLIIGLNYGKKAPKNPIDDSILNETFNSKGAELVYIGREDCGYCVMFEPHLKYLASEYDFEYVYVNTNLAVETELDKILAKLEIKTEGFGTPHVTFVTNGKVTGQIAGYIDEEELFNELKSNGIIGKDAVYIANTATGTEGISFIGVDELVSLNNSKTDFFVVYGRTDCSWCTKFKPVLSKVAEDKNIKVYYIELDKLTSEEQEKMRNEIEIFKKVPSFGTPNISFTSNGKYVDHVEGYMEEGKLLKVLKKNGYVN